MNFTIKDILETRKQTEVIKHIYACSNFSFVGSLRALYSNRGKTKLTICLLFLLSSSDKACHSTCIANFGWGN